MVSVFEL